MKILTAFTLSFSLSLALAQSYLDRIDFLCQEKALLKWEDQGRVIPTYSYWLSKLYDIKPDSLLSLKHSLKEAIRNNARLLAYALGINQPETIESLYPLTGGQFGELLQHLRTELFANPDLERIKELLGDACNEDLNNRIQALLARAELVKQFSPEQIDLILSTFDSTFRETFSQLNQAGVTPSVAFDFFEESFRKQLRFCKMFSRRKLKFLLRVFADSRLKELRDEPLGQHYLQGLIGELRLMNEKEFAESSYFHLTQRPLSTYKVFNQCIKREVTKYFAQNPKHFSLSTAESDKIAQACFKEVGTS